MATTGTIALEKLQAGLEVTRGTPVAATKKIYAERGNAWFEHQVTREFLAENMGSYIEFYRHVDTAVSGKLTLPAYLTGADAAWYGQLAWGSTAPTGPTNSTVYTWTWSPATLSVASDTLKTATFEAYSDTQAYQLPFSLLDKFEITWQAGQAVRIASDFLCQQVLAQGITGGLTDRTGLNAIAGTTAKVWIDNGGGTIGTTQYNNVVSGKITWQNNWQPITHLLGQLYYDDAIRLPRSVDLELDLHFKDTAEFSQLLGNGERLIRVQFSGPAITGSSPTTNETVICDFYGFYSGAAFSAGRAARMVKMSGKSQFDTSAGFDWRVQVQNGLNYPSVTP